MTHLTLEFIARTNHASIKVGTSYIERQLAAFAQGIRQNDILEQMRIIAGQLTPDEMHALAMFYGTPSNGPGGLAFR